MLSGTGRYGKKRATAVPIETSFRSGALVCAVVSSLLLPTAFAQPPGTPAPTMKSLDQIASQGIAINATNTPGDASDEFSADAGNVGNASNSPFANIQD